MEEEIAEEQFDCFGHIVRGVGGRGSKKNVEEGEKKEDQDVHWKKTGTFAIKSCYTILKIFIQNWQWNKMSRL